MTHPNPHKSCHLCKGRLAYQMTTYTQLMNDNLIVIENVPAWVCEQCGETYYDPDVVERIQTLIWSGKAPARTIQTPVYDLSA
jgi:YgiT-type zinc finger domain-containing protein